MIAHSTSQSNLEKTGQELSVGNSQLKKIYLTFKSLIFKHVLFSFCVALPLLISTLYYGLIANDIYVSESIFVVRAPNKQQSGGGVGSLIAQFASGSGNGFAAAFDDANAVKDFISSRDSLALLENKLEFRKKYSDKKINLLQRFNGFGIYGSFEELFQYYLKRVAVITDHNTSSSKLIVQAFDAQTSLQINSFLLNEAEKLVNNINERARRDLVKFAQNEVQSAEEKAKSAALALSNYRNTHGVVDPQKQVVIHFEQLAKLQEQYIATKGQLTQVSEFAPDSPHSKSLKLKMEVLEEEIKAEKERITGGSDSLASKAAEYERLALELEFADQQLALTMASLESARNQALRQQLYLMTIAQPNLPDEAVLPERIRGIVTTLVLGLVGWGILSMLLAGVREHQY
jgi:capsular polysaccharide transport system permease protein